MGKLHFIGNAHLDICWFWDIDEGLQEVRATFRSAIDRIKEYDSHIFTSACSSYYEAVKKIDKRLFSEIKNAIENGRWHIVGGWYLQPDCNSPSGESFVRHGLYGQLFFEENFGITATSGYNVDSFGHNGNLPQILRLQEMDSYVFMRPSIQESGNAKEYAFIWQGIDGSRVTAARVPISYETSEAWGAGLRKKTSLEEDISDEKGIPLMCFYGVGDHGGGPTKENIEFLKRYIQDNALSRFSTPRDYFDEIKSYNLSVYNGELQHHAIGCYSLRLDIKQLNAKCENALQRAEKLSYLFKDIINYGGLSSFFKGNWKKVLFNQFHDILGGCCSSSVYETVRDRYGNVLDSLRGFCGEIIQRIGSIINTRDGMKLIIVNTLPWPVREAIDLNSTFSKITDSENEDVPFQLIKAEPTTNLCAFRTRAVFDIPAFGYRVWNISDASLFVDPVTLRDHCCQLIPRNEIFNGIFSVCFDKERKQIGNIFFNGKLVISSIIPTIIDDPSDAWSHGITRFEGLRTYLPISEIRVYTEGLVSTEYEIIYQYNRSEIRLRVRLDSGLDNIDIGINVFWAEQHKMLKLVFALPVASGSFFSEIPYGYIERPSNLEEWPCQRWISKASNGFMVGIINDGLYSCSSNKSTLEYGILRSPAAAHHVPANLSNTTFHSFVDQGEHHARLMVSVRTDNSEFSKLATQFNQKPFSLIESIHDGYYPERRSHNLDMNGAYISTIKPAEKSDGYIIRIVETSGTSHSEVLTLGSNTVDLMFSPFEIKTLFLDKINDSIKEVNLLER